MNDILNFHAQIRQSAGVLLQIEKCIVARWRDLVPTGQHNKYRFVVKDPTHHNQYNTRFSCPFSPQIDYLAMGCIRYYKLAMWFDILKRSRRHMERAEVGMHAITNPEHRANYLAI